MANVGGVAFTPKHASVARNSQFRLRRINSYCEGMQYNCEVGADGEMRVNIGQPPAADADLIVTAVALTANETFSAVLANSEVDAPYGRALVIAASIANTRACTISGWDYLGQPMTEVITFDGSTPVVGKKAFFFVGAVDVGDGTDTSSITVGTTDKFGLPFYTVALIRELIDGANVTSGAVTAGLQGAQTTTSADPRGLYVPVTTPDGAVEFVATVVVASMITEGVGKFNHPVMQGGLHGTRHYAA